MQLKNAMNDKKNSRIYKFNVEPYKNMSSCVETANRRNQLLFKNLNCFRQTLDWLSLKSP